MKWTQKLTAALFLALSMFTFTSCDDDEPWDYYNYYEDWYDNYDWYQDPFNYGNSTLNAEAAALRGYWTGMIEYQYYDNGQLQAETMYADFEFETGMEYFNKRLAPQVQTVYLACDSAHIHISSSAVRELIEHNVDIGAMVPREIYESIRERLTNNEQ